MAPISSGQLKAALAEAMLLSDYQVDYPHRVVQQAAEVSRGKRGRGGADVTPRDAAITIIAIACSFISVEVLRGVREFSVMPCQHTAYHTGTPDGWTTNDDGLWQVKGFELPHLQQLPARHTFVDALTAVIEAVRDKAFDVAFKQAYPDETLPIYNIHVVFGGPDADASIAIDMWAGEYHYQEEAGYFLDEKREATREQMAARTAFRIEIKIDHHPISAVATLFRDQLASDT